VFALPVETCGEVFAFEIGEAVAPRAGLTEVDAAHEFAGQRWRVAAGAAVGDLFPLGLVQPPVSDRMVGLDDFWITLADRLCGRGQCAPDKQPSEQQTV
jgi:hypothetical protein